MSIAGLCNLFRVRKTLRTRRTRAVLPGLDSPEQMMLEPRCMLSGNVIAGVVQMTGIPAPGEPFTLRVLQPDGTPFPPGMIASLKWNIPNAVANRTINTAGVTGQTTVGQPLFNDTPLNTWTYGTDSISGYWTTAGPQAVSVEGFEVSPTLGGIPMYEGDEIAGSGTIQIVAPESSIVLTPLNQTDIYTSTKSETGYKVGAAMNYTVTVANTIKDPITGLIDAVPGSFGLVQTAKIQSISTFWPTLPTSLAGVGKTKVGENYVDPSTGLPYNSLLDNSPQDVQGWPTGTAKTSPAVVSALGANSPLLGKNSPYYFSFGQNAQPTFPNGTVLKTGDAPNFLLGYDEASVVRKDTFYVNLIETPTAPDGSPGIPVQLGVATWGWGAYVQTTLKFSFGSATNHWDLVAFNDPKEIGSYTLTTSTTPPITFDVPVWKGRTDYTISRDQVSYTPTPTQFSSGDLPPLPAEVDPWADITVTPDTPLPPGVSAPNPLDFSIFDERDDLTWNDEALDSVLGGLVGVSASKTHRLILGTPGSNPMI